MYTVIIVALVILILVRRTDFTIWWYQLTNRHLKAGELAFQQGSSPAAAASLLTTAANQGHIEAAVPLGKLFEEADEPHNAALVYNVLEGRTRDVSPVLNAYAMERLDLLQAQRLAAPVTPVRLAVQERVLTLNPPVEIKVKPKEKPKVVITSDPHSVHDSGVVRSLATTYQRLRAAAPNSITIEETVRQVRELCAAKKNNRALKALDSVERSVIPVHALDGAKEVEVLQTVWNRIKTSHDTTIQDTLVDSLADSVDQRGNVVCTQGKISRIIDSLNVVDPLVSLKPRWATRTELLEMAAKLRNENPDDDTMFKTQLRERARTLYVTTGLMSQKVLDAEIDSWVDDI
jgi:hypothetical protein